MFGGSSKQTRVSEVGILKGIMPLSRRRHVSFSLLAAQKQHRLLPFTRPKNKERREPVSRNPHKGLLGAASPEKTEF